jgi:glycosyltransferase involved in cell wall biosynthesis
VSQRRRVLLVQPSLQPPGGGNGVAAWMLQALSSEHHVTVLSWRPVDVDSINRFFGTSLHASHFDTIVVPRTWTLVPDRLPVPAALLRTSLLMRFTRRVSDAFDVIVGAHNEVDYGRRGIQYVHYPTYLRPRPAVDWRWYHHAPIALDAYYRVADRIAGFSLERLKANLTLVNSNWTGRLVAQSLGIVTETLYPPVVDPALQPPWTERARGFLAVGRISPEKELDRVMRVLARVRVAHPDLTLTVVGTTDRHGRQCFRKLQRLASSMGSWVRFRLDVPRDEVRQLMATHRYGIHGMREEHFGMAPAEMVRAGCLVWVRRGGGQVEIVGEQPRLLYDTDDDAVEKIISVLDDANEEDRLRQALAARAAGFSTRGFVDRIRAIVRDFRE